jgi:hypothetical protein
MRLPVNLQAKKDQKGEGTSTTQPHVQSGSGGTQGVVNQPDQEEAYPHWSQKELQLFVIELDDYLRQLDIETVPITRVDQTARLSETDQGS